ncbi:winged helix-turn-helix transcriptional regulator [Kitasatospora indigofera]|uniref:winged helix-turn-helix transcriptional regulator n=1 Tax=Kitasatospora indigofera TaxID=67307 RepID=UPI00363EE0C5
MLTRTLRGPEADGIVRQESFPVLPPHVEYSPTPLGDALAPLPAELCRWAGTHLDEVRAARAGDAAR